MRDYAGRGFSSVVCKLSIEDCDASCSLGFKTKSATALYRVRRTSHIKEIPALDTVALASQSSIKIFESYKVSNITLNVEVSWHRRDAESSVLIKTVEVR